MHKNIPIILLAVFGSIILAGYFSAIAFTLVYGMKSPSDEIMITRLSDLAFMVVGFFFSSSLGSKTKDKK